MASQSNEQLIKYAVLAFAGYALYEYYYGGKDITGGMLTKLLGASAAPVSTTTSQTTTPPTTTQPATTTTTTTTTQPATPAQTLSATAQAILTAAQSGYNALAQGSGPNIQLTWDEWNYYADQVLNAGANDAGFPGSAAAIAAYNNQPAPVTVTLPNPELFGITRGANGQTPFMTFAQYWSKVLPYFQKTLPSLSGLGGPRRSIGPSWGRLPVSGWVQ